MNSTGTSTCETVSASSTVCTYEFPAMDGVTYYDWLLMMAVILFFLCFYPISIFLRTFYKD
jgi:hypothetical protein